MDGIRPVVGVTGMNATDNPAPGVGVARSLRTAPQFKGRIIGLGYDPLDPGFYAEGLLDGGAILPFPSAGREAVFHKLRHLKSEFGLEVLLPTLDSELRVVAALQPELTELGMAVLVPELECIEAASKARLPALAERAQLRVPESEAITTPSAMGRLFDRLGAPLVVKGVYYGASIAHNELEAVAAFHGHVAAWGLPAIVQKHIQGEEYNVAALGDGTGRTVGAVPMRKMALTDKGKAWAGVTIRDEQLLDTTRRVIEELEWRGGIEVELMRETKTGELYVMEINPRFPAWVHLATSAGQNFPFAAVRLAMGLAVPTLGDYRVGTRFVRITLDQTGDLATFGALSQQGQVDFAGSPA
ncbi:MAG: ATP-grasp domain-containing protein [Polyangiaceae bacterium]|nr:ATP-grasp domain-containing protein [Polyangiaceae bacterium]